MRFFVHMLLSSAVIATTAWLARAKPGLGGFLISLPLSTLIVLPLLQIQTGDTGATELARSIFWALPLSLVFFLPFLASERWGLGFWTSYFSGIALLAGAYFVHRAIVGQ